MLAKNNLYKHIIIWIAPILIGTTIALLAYTSNFAFAYFSMMAKIYFWFPFVTLTLGGIVLTKLMKIGGSNVEGSGIQQTIAAIHLSKRPSIIAIILNLRLAFLKFVTIVGGLGSGFILGLEGPTVQIGACIFNSFRRFIPYDNAFIRRQIIMAGGAAGIAAAYNAPFAAIIFAFEELYFELKFSTIIKVAIAVILSDIMVNPVFGYSSYFGELYINQTIPFAYWHLILILALLGGLLGGLISWLAIKSLNYIHSQNFYKKHTYIFITGCGFIIAIIGVFAPIFGSGADIARHLLDEQIEVAWYYTPLKILGFLTTFVTGLPGGVFTPSLSIGAGFGNYFTYFTAAPWHPHFIALGMISILAAVTRAPFTACFIMIEMSYSPGLLPYALFTALISSFAASIFKIHFYEDLAKTILGHIQPSPKKV